MIRIGTRLIRNVPLLIDFRFFSRWNRAFSLSLYLSLFLERLSSSSVFFLHFFFPPPPVSVRENGSSSIDRTHRVLPKTRKGRLSRCIDQPFSFFFSFFSLSVFVFRLGEYFLFLFGIASWITIEMYRDLKRCK